MTTPVTRSCSYADPRPVTTAAFAAMVIDAYAKQGTPIQRILTDNGGARFSLGEIAAVDHGGEFIG